MKHKVLILIPAYNEGRNIYGIIKNIKETYPELDILVVNDCSTDDTRDILADLHVDHINLISNLGYGGALETGYKYALLYDYNIVIQMDADGQHDVINIKDFIKEYEKGETDVILGSRFLSSKSYNPPILRIFGIRVFSLIVKMATGRSFTDPTTGYQLLNYSVLKYYIDNKLFPQDYPDADMLIILSYYGIRIKEIPVSMHKNKDNKTMHSGLRPIYYVIKMLMSIIIIILSKKELKGLK